MVRWKTTTGPIETQPAEHGFLCLCLINPVVVVAELGAEGVAQAGRS